MTVTLWLAAGGAGAGAELLTAGGAGAQLEEAAGELETGATEEGAGDQLAPPAGVVVATTAGVVEAAPELAGQLVTVGPHEVMVTSSVSKTVVSCWAC